MGNSSTRLSVVIQPPTNPHSNGRHVAGSMLRGTVYLQVNDSVDMNDVSLQLRFKGSEKTCVEYYEVIHDRDGDGNSIERRIPRQQYGKRNIIEMALPISSPEGGGEVMNAGSYSYPFEFQLPISLPSTMKVFGGYNEGECEVKYKIEAVIKRAGSWGGGKEEEVEVPIMAAPPSSEPVGYFVQPVTQPIKSCCCFNRGDVTFGANVDDTRVGSGESMKVDFGCKNESGIEIETVEAVVRQHVHWSAGYHFNDVTNHLVERDFMQTQDMQARSKEELNQIKMNENSQFQSRSMDLYREIRQIVQEGSNSVQLDIPYAGMNNICDTYSGQLIQVSHTLSITMQTPGCCTSNPSVDIPMQIVSPEAVEGNNDEEGGGYDAPAPALDGWDAGNVTTIEPAYPVSNPILGGNATDAADDEDDIIVDPFNNEMGGGEPPSLTLLLQKLDQSISPKSTVKDLINDSEWGDVFASLAPNDYAAIIKRVKVEFDQADVANMIAEVIEGFVCAHVIAAYGAVKEWTREQLVRKLLNHCTDVKENANSIFEILTDWERVCLERDFEKVKEG